MPTLLDSLYDQHGSHFIEEKNGKYSITFLYRAPNSSPNPEVTLVCHDLYDRTLGEDGNPRKFTKEPGSNMYSLRIENIPSVRFATYHINVKGVERPHLRHPPNQRPLTMHRLELNGESISMVQERTLYIGEDVPDYLMHELPSELKGSATPGTFKSKANEERSTWVYKPEGFDKLPSDERKVIFMLDGKDFCERLTPYIDAKGEPFSNTAIVFIDPATPGRVYEDYVSTDEFAKLLSEELIRQYCGELEVKNKDNVILAAHSLAAYPMTSIAESHPEQIGGLFLFSPALNLNNQLNLPEHPDPELQQLPIFMQIGQLENTKPPAVHQKRETRDMQDKSRLKANEEFHQSLVEHKYNVESSLRVHSYGHDPQHVFEGMVQGMEFYQRQLRAKSEVAVVTPTEPMPKRTVHFINGTPPRIDEVESSKVLTADELAKGDRILVISGPSSPLSEGVQPELLLIVGKSDVLERQDQAKQQIRAHIPPDMDDVSMVKLIGLLQKNKGSSIDRERTTIAGEGLGAVAAMRTALVHPDLIGHADLLTLPESESKACLVNATFTSDPTLPKVSFTVTNGPSTVLKVLTTLRHPVESKETRSVTEASSQVATEPMQPGGTNINPTPYS